MAEVVIRYWAAAKEAAGVPEESVAVATLAGALNAVVASRSPDRRLHDVLERSSFLINGTRASRRCAEEVALPEGAVIEVLPPFAGG